MMLLRMLHSPKASYVFTVIFLFKLGGATSTIVCVYNQPSPENFCFLRSFALSEKGEQERCTRDFGWLGAR